MKNIKTNRTLFLSLLSIFFITTSYSQVASKKPLSAGPTECAKTAAVKEAKERGIAFLTNDEILYSIRDKTLNSTVKGKKYVEDYYYISNVEKDYSKLETATLLEMVRVMSSIYSANDNYNNSTFKGIIIDTETGSSIMNVLKNYKLLSSDSKYLLIIDNLISDLKFITNREKTEVLSFMNK